jgi:uncharacterized protein YdeI (YjbR/CyaY-like superfamily)
MKTLDVRTRPAWRRWLEKHHDSDSEVWVLFHKVHTGVQSIPYDDAVEEALCFGWIDSLIKRIDDGRYARKFTPRKAGSRWSDINRRRYARAKAKGLLRAAGLERPPTATSTPPLSARLSEAMEQKLMAHPRAWERFEGLPPSHRRAYAGWVESAKREETKDRRLSELVAALMEGRTLGMK